MKKLSTLTVGSIVLSGLVLSASPALANNGNGKGKGHTEVAICHGGKLITIDDNGLNGHKNHSGDKFGEGLTEADCTIPPQPAPLFPEGDVTTTYQCDVKHPTRTDHITFTRIDYVYDENSNSWVLGPEQKSSSQHVFFLTAEQVLEHCKPTPGDLPISDNPVAGTPDSPVGTVTPVTPETPTVSETPAEDMTYPAAPPATTDLVLDNTVPAESAPLANLGSVEQAPVAPNKPTQLANTGWESTLAILGGLALVGGTILVGLRRKLAS